MSHLVFPLNLFLQRELQCVDFFFLMKYYTDICGSPRRNPNDFGATMRLTFFELRKLSVYAVFMPSLSLSLSRFALCVCGPQEE